MRNPRRSLHSVLVRAALFAAALVLLAAPALGQYKRDAAANKKIREAIDVHYLSTDFDKALGVLTGTIQACEDQCSPATLARAWMYVGIVRGVGKKDYAGAEEAFRSALELDPKLALDADLATPETIAAFEKAGGAGAAQAAPAEAEPETAPAAPAEPRAEVEGGISCTPRVATVETRRPIPVECRTDAAAAAVELRYKTFGDEWQSRTMTRHGDSFRAQITCDETASAGALELFVRAKDESGDEIAGWGSKSKPIEIQLVEVGSETPPSFDGSPPPQRCAAKEDCPPNFPGCESKTRPTCDSDADCAEGVCVEGACEAEPPPAPYAKNLFGLHFAQDFTFVGGDDVCTQANQTDLDFACYYGGSRSGAYVDEPYPGSNVGSGLVLATQRVLLSYDRALTPNLLAGLRVGFAFGGGPPSGRNVTYDDQGRVDQVLEEGQAFLPLHAELRASYWFGVEPLARPGFRPYLHVGGGLAQVDAKVTLPVEDCGLFAPPGTPEYADCAAGRVPSDDPSLTEVELDAWKKMGQGFLTLGGGVAYAFSRDLAAQLNLNVMYMLPASGLVIQPSLGLTHGL